LKSKKVSTTSVSATADVDATHRVKSNTITSKYLRMPVFFDRLENVKPLEGQSHSCNLLGEVDLLVRDEWDVILDITGWENQTKQDKKWPARVKEGFNWKGHDCSYQDFLVDEFKTVDARRTRSIDVNWDHVNIDE
jgi:hypothetical protein